MPKNQKWWPQLGEKLGPAHAYGSPLSKRAKYHTCTLVITASETTLEFRDKEGNLLETRKVE